VPDAVPDLDPDLTARLDAHLEPFVGSGDFSGYVILARGGRAVVSCGYGWADREFEVAHTTETVSWAGSISKLFTRVAFDALFAQGRVTATDRLADFLPSYPDAGRITIQQLLDHTAGIARDLVLGPARTEPHTTSELVELVAALPPVGAPGDQTSYSNNGYRILARVLELVTGEDFDDAVRQIVFEPRAMSSTLSPDLLDVVPRLAPGYVAGPGLGTVRRAAYYNVRNEPGAGAFFTTPQDLWTFARSLREYDDLAEPEGDHGDRRFGHNGLGHGYAAYCDRYPDADAEVVMLANLETGLFGRLRDDLRDLVLGRPLTPVEPLPTPALFDEAAAARVVGEYELGPASAPLTFRTTDGHLEVSAGEEFFPLVPTGVDTYFMRLKFARLSFSPDAAVLTWSEGGWQADLPRRVRPG
jgi:CubicO group peptidase (beta-lactamase class C family)